MWFVDYFGKIYGGLHAAMATKLGTSSVVITLFAFCLILHLIFFPVKLLGWREEKAKRVLSDDILSIRRDFDGRKKKLLEDGLGEYSEEIIDLEMDRDKKISSLYRRQRVIRGSYALAGALTAFITIISFLIAWNLPRYLGKLNYIYDNVAASAITAGDETIFLEELDADLVGDADNANKKMYTGTAAQWNAVIQRSKANQPYDPYSPAYASMQRIIGFGKQSIGVSVKDGIRVLDPAVIILFIAAIVFSLSFRIKRTLLRFRNAGNIDTANKDKENRTMSLVVSIAISICSALVFLSLPVAVLYVLFLQRAFSFLERGIEKFVVGA